MAPCPRPLVGLTGFGFLVGSGGTYLAVGTGGFMVAAGRAAGFEGMDPVPAAELNVGI